MKGYFFGTFGGRCVRKPEISTTANGTLKAKFTVARNAGFGQQQESDFWQVVAYGKIAETCETYVDKGKELHLLCEVRNQSYEKDGEKKTFPHLVVKEMVFGAKGSSAEGQKEPAYQERSRERQAPPAQQMPTHNFDDVPF